MATVQTLCDETGVTYRQANHWISKNYIPGVHPVGSGYPLTLNGYQSDFFRVMAWLVLLGIKPDKASFYAEVFLRDGFYFIDSGNVRMSLDALPDKQRQSNSG